MDTIIFILKKRSQHFLDKENKAELILTLLSMAGYFYLPKLLSTAILAPGGIMTPSVLYIVTNILLFMPLFALFFPTFEGKKNILPAYLPIPKSTLFLLDFIAGIGKRPSLSIIAMTSGFIVYFPLNNPPAYLSVGLAGIISLMYVDLFTNVLSWQKKHGWVAVIIVAVLSLLPIWIQIGLNTALFLQTLSVFILCVSIWYSYSLTPPKPAGQKMITSAKNRAVRSILLKEVTRSDMVRNSILLVFVFKIFILFGLPYLGESHATGSEVSITYLLFYSPFFLFASIFNNSFGYFRSLFFSVWLYNNRPGQYIRLFFNLMIPFFLADMVISIVFLAWFKQLIWQNLVIYFSSSLYLIIVAIITSCLIPKKIEERSLSGVKKGSSTWSSLISMTPFFVIAISHLKQAYVAHLICLGIALIASVIFITTSGAKWQAKVIQTLS